MKNKKLIPLSDFVLERVGKITALQLANEVVAYTKFLKQPLTLGMLVPCDEEGNILKKPADDDFSFYTHKNQSVQEEYKEAKGKVLFEGFTYEKIPVMGDILNFKGKFICMADDLKNSKATIEDWIKDNSIYELTPSALQQIGVE